MKYIAWSAIAATPQDAEQQFKNMVKKANDKQLEIVSVNTPVQQNHTITVAILKKRWPE
ncbi:MAG: hypothetical protein PVG03_17430 [Desulfarculaceae bacterium]|jgi:hypothetical protein